jgi:ABC-2 type transport system permease protein
MNAIQITHKDLLLLYRDRRTLSVLVALPLAFIMILGSSTGKLFSNAQQAAKYKVGVVDDDRTDMSASVIDKMREISALAVTDYPDRQSAEAARAEGRIHVLLHIGPKFHDYVEKLEVDDILHIDEGRLKGRLKSLNIEVEAGSFLANASELVQIVVFDLAGKTIAPIVVKKDHKLALQIKLASERSRKRIEDQLENSPVELPTEAAQSDSGLSTAVYQILVPSYTVMFVFFIVNIMARSFIGERDLGTLNRLRLAPISRPGIMVGKTVPFLIISLIQTALLFVAGRFLFQMSWGPQPWLLLPVMVCTSLAATSLGLMVATLVRTDAQVSAYGNFLVLTMAGISGCMMPRAWQPELMQQVGLITPHAWALIAYDQILNRPHAELSVVINCCEMLLAFTGGFFAIGWWRSRHLE